MVTRGPHATLFVPPACRWHALLVTGLALAGVACASASVENVIKHDAATTGGAGGGSGGQGGSGGATTGVCNPFSNSGCAPAQKCTALQSGSAARLGCGSKGSRSAGETCAQVWTGNQQTGDDCGEGLACLDPSGGGSTCHRVCAPAASSCACGADEICSLFVSGLDSSGYALCRSVVKCQPLEQTGCGDQQACYFTTSTCYTGPQCASIGNVAPGGMCSIANDCKPGSTCVTVGGNGVCSSFCSMAEGGTPSCSGASTGGNTCASLGGDTGEPNVGSCRQQP